MITLITASSRHVLTPTIFPDGTSQVWKLPNDILRSSSVDVDWRFESEREIIDLFSLKKLIPNQLGNLHVPYLPYARQDKEITNSSTFNLEVFADLINSIGFASVTAVDVHNADKTETLINNFTNYNVDDFHERAITTSEPDYLVFPDKGAQSRYGDNFDHISRLICDKTRDQLTGNITGHKVVDCHVSPFANGKPLAEARRFLIIDDLCDGGATFVSVAKLLRTTNPNVKVDLCVTHGLFSKGREALLNNGINVLYTTDSLTKNGDGYKV